MSRLPSAPRRAAAFATLLAACSLAAGVLALSACDGGAIGASTPASNGQSFVTGDSGATVFGAGKGPRVPRVSGTTLTGAKLSLSQYSGDVVVMNFWGSWCTPCRAEAPTLASLSRRYDGRGVRFLGIDIRDSTATAKAFLSNFHIGYPSLNDPGDEVALAFRGAVTPAGIPTTLVIGRDGRIAARIVGEVSYQGLKGLISRAMAEPS
ncbi:MAG TPA: TlpA disulfide reductase family protein [Streptosporangiaceae bacterium]